MNLDIGCTVGDYQIIGILGAGGMGKVFKVRNTISDRIEAMKVLLPDLTGEPELADRFLREIKVLASLQHPNIAGLHTAARCENQLLMLMELVEGVTLEEKLQQGPLSVAEAVGYTGQVLEALSYAHRQGVIHRDIKPANMMLTANGTIKLMDFGIAKSAGDRKLTMTGTTMGSLYYMSPEQIRGTQALDARSDLYSVGVTLYQLVTGKRPFDGDSQFAIMSAHLEKAPVPPITIDPSLPPALNEVILLSVNKDPDGRFQSADAFRNALLSVTAAAAPAPLAGPGVPAVAHRPRRGLWAAAGALCTVAVIIAAIEFLPSRKASAGKQPAASQVDTPPPQPLPAQQPPPAATPPAASTEAPPPSPVPAPPVKEARPAREGSRVPAPVAQRSAPQPPPQERAPATAPQQPPAVSQQPPAQPQQTQPASTPPDVSARRAELQSLRESLVGARHGSNGMRVSFFCGLNLKVSYTVRRETHD
jgi:serine/threonine-protein kinase